MPPKKQANPLDLILLLLVLFTAYVALITIPADSDYNDIHIAYTISKPLVEAVEFDNLEATVQPHTILGAPPALASILTSGITSGTVKISAETASTKASKTIGEIYRTDEESGTLVIRKVPLDETEVTMKLYEDSKLVKTEKIYVGKDE